MLRKMRGLLVQLHTIFFTSREVMERSLVNGKIIEMPGMEREH